MHTSITKECWPLEPPAFRSHHGFLEMISHLFYFSQLKSLLKDFLWRNSFYTKGNPRFQLLRGRKLFTVYGLLPRLPPLLFSNYPQGFKTFRVQSRQRHASCILQHQHLQHEEKLNPDQWHRATENICSVFGGIEQDKETPLWSIQTAHCVTLRTSSDCGKAGSNLIIISWQTMIGSHQMSIPGANSPMAVNLLQIQQRFSPRCLWSWGWPDLSECVRQLPTRANSWLCSEWEDLSVELPSSHW